MSKRPFISVVTPSLNQGRFIRANIESVIAQEFDGVEHIVIDGGSTDETVEILKQYPELKWISEKDCGQAGALNKGLEMSRGEWIAWVNSDDYLLPGALKKLSAFAASHGGARFVFSNGLYTDADGNERDRIRVKFTKDDLHYWWRRGHFTQTGTFFKRSLWEKFGPFDVSLNYTMDFDFWLKIADEAELHYLDDYLVAYRLHEASKTGQGQLRFSKEKVGVSRRYWDAKGGLAKWKYRLLLHMAYGRELTLEGISRWEGGKRAEGSRLFLEGYARNPLCLFAWPNLCFWLRRMMGVRLYERARAAYRARTGREPKDEKPPRVP